MQTNNLEQVTKEMIDIFDYTNIHEFLNHRFEEKRKMNSSFSIRAWAQQIGMSSHGGLQQVLAGKRSVPKKYIPSLIKSLRLEVDEANYLETMIDFEKAKSDEESAIYQDRLEKLKPKKLKLNVIEIDSYHYFKNPLHSIVRTMIERPDFENCPNWIQSQLRIEASVQEISDVIERLVSLGFVQRKNGKLIKINNHIKNKIDIPSEAVREYHKKMSSHAASEISKQEIDQREYNSFCMNIQKSRINEAKRKIRDFVNEFISEFEEKENADSTYHLNLQFFGLTNDLNKSEMKEQECI